MDTFAVPQVLHFRPIQLSAVPVKLNVAVVGVFALWAVPSLKAAVSVPRSTQAGSGLPTIAELSFSTRSFANGGASGWSGVPPPPMLLGPLLSTRYRACINFCTSRVHP